jgi:hypothetical protein
MLTDSKAYDRFMAKVLPEPNTGCWLWTAGVTHGGYGYFTDNGPVGAHVFSYRYHHGEVPPGFVVHHRCNVTCCVNPAHLEAVTNSVNVKEGLKFAASRRPLPKEEDVTSFRDIVRLWPTQEIFADEMGVNFWAVVGWNRRDSIPADYWRTLGRVAAARGIEFLTLDFLVALAAKKRRSRKKS